MLYVKQDGTIARCYNGITDCSFQGPPAAQACGFTVSTQGVIVGNHGGFLIDFGFRVSDRFISVTPRTTYPADVGATFLLAGDSDLSPAKPLTENQIYVETFLTDVDYVHAEAPANFMIIVY